jgi:UPF0042 nucleotide-binding protein
MTPEAEDKTTPRGPRVVFVTGPSGAGRTTAINALEDLGFEAIDNLPLSLLPRLLEGPPPERPMALGTDARNRDFSAKRLLEEYERLSATPGLEADLLYLDCEPLTLQRRYSETRRRHPLAPDDDPANGIARELDLLGPLRRRASVLVDTTTLSPHELRNEMGRLFAPARWCETVADRDLFFLPTRAAHGRGSRLRLPVSPQPSLGAGTAAA